MNILKGKGLRALKVLPIAAAAAVAMLGFAPSAAHAETVERNYEFRSHMQGNQWSSISYNQWKLGTGSWQTLADTDIALHGNYMKTHALDTISTNGRKFKLVVNGQTMPSGNWADTDYVQISSRVEHFNSFPVGTITLTRSTLVFAQHRGQNGAADYKSESSFWNDVRSIAPNTASTPAEQDVWNRDPYANTANHYKLNVKVIFEDGGTPNAEDGSATYVKYKDSGEDYNGEWTNKDLVIEATLKNAAQNVTLRRNSAEKQSLSNVSKASFDITQETDKGWRYQGDNYTYFFKYGSGVSLTRSPMYYVKIDKTKPVLDYDIDAAGTLTDKSDDALSGIAKVEIQVDGGEWQVLRQGDGNGGTTGTGTYQFAQDEIKHSFRYRVSDIAGNVLEESGSYKSGAKDPSVDPVVPGDDSGNEGDGFTAQSVR